jgi:hypothetical protein
MISKRSSAAYGVFANGIEERARLFGWHGSVAPLAP